ncbi:heme NO-binding domain-containing protein (plasmid) [Catenovulum sp. SX2]|uniref:heme NO-binding domain-containing protein n=1 Tax=Catenovulum sp. SX2 TaxID=3398614 RepID=UPI003F845A7A
MKGHIFNLLEEFIEEASDETTLFKILDACSFDTSKSFVRTENYPDEQLFELVGHAVNALGITPDQAQFAFGEWIFPRLASLVPKNMTTYAHPGKFLETVDHIHKVELKKLYPDATPPSFDYKAISDTQAELVYTSERNLVKLVEGVLQGVAKYFSTQIEVETIPQPELGNTKFVLRYV